jgi:DNA processing protein
MTWWEGGPRDRDPAEHAGARGGGAEPREIPGRPATRAVSPGDLGYPERLAGASPPTLYLAGPWDHAGPVVAIVGSRSADGDGRDLAHDLARELAMQGVAIVSGLARGIDSAAHRGALEAGGRSGAVLGTSLAECYPPEHRRLQDTLARSLGLMTRVPPGAPAARSTFAQRNRVLAAISDAVVLVQGAERSGSLLTAHAARAFGCPLGAVPWDPREPLSAAPLGLIRSGAAALVRGAEDVLELLGLGPTAPSVSGASPAPPAPPQEDRDTALGERELRLLRSLRRRGQSLDRVAERAGLASAEVGAALVLLEILGYAERAPGGLVRLARKR